eukprot:Platyproteum_vivax@DN8386_c0_g1_i1.p1
MLYAAPSLSVSLPCTCRRGSTFGISFTYKSFFSPFAAAAAAAAGKEVSLPPPPPPPPPPYRPMDECSTRLQANEDELVDAEALLSLASWKSSSSRRGRLTIRSGRI